MVDPKTGEPITEAGRVGPDRDQAAAGRRMMRTYWNNTATYYEQVPERLVHLRRPAPASTRTATSGSCGRDDDVINTGGHLVGPVRDRVARCSSTRRWPSRRRSASPTR
ncbi:MAG: hypothetical protein MZW92_10030 [Comamonadaceae bacterium]|nr:hypothetical protein [Comamonadaceae bacterium]